MRFDLTSGAKVLLALGGVMLVHDWGQIQRRGACEAPALACDALDLSTAGAFLLSILAINVGCGIEIVVGPGLTLPEHATVLGLGAAVYLPTVPA